MTLPKTYVLNKFFFKEQGLLVKSRALRKILIMSYKIISRIVNFLLINSIGVAKEPHKQLVPS